MTTLLDFKNELVRQADSSAKKLNSFSTVPENDPVFNQEVLNYVSLISALRSYEEFTGQIATFCPVVCKHDLRGILTQFITT